jgi:hypothetical protein
VKLYLADATIFAALIDRAPFGRALRFRYWNWIPASAGMTMPGTDALNVIIPAKSLP